LFYQASGEGGKTSYLIGSNAFLGRRGAGGNKLFVDIDSSADWMDDF